MRNQWPSLPISRRESKNCQNRDGGEERWSPEFCGRIVDIRLDTRSSTPIKENREYSRRSRETYNQKESERKKNKKTNEKENKNSFYDLYDQREGEIRKEDWGIALKNVSTENIHKTDMTTQRIYEIDEEPIPGSFAQNKEVLTGLYLDTETKRLSYVLN